MEKPMILFNLNFKELKNNAEQCDQLLSFIANRISFSAKISNDKEEKFLIKFSDENSAMNNLAYIVCSFINTFFPMTHFYTTANVKKLEQFNKKNTFIEIISDRKFSRMLKKMPRRELVILGGEDCVDDTVAIQIYRYIPKEALEIIYNELFLNESIYLEVTENGGSNNADSQ